MTTLRHLDTWDQDVDNTKAIFVTVLQNPRMFTFAA